MFLVVKRVYCYCCRVVVALDARSKIFRFAAVGCMQVSRSEREKMVDAAVNEAAAAASEEVKQYRIHVSSRYLDLTKQKLEITRLPREIAEPKSEDWWEPKAQVEPLIDFWLEQYSWRVQEDELNSELPQFRTAFTIPGTEVPVRTHFIHIRSSHSNAIPLLLIPPFPFTNLSFGYIIKSFADPEDAASNQPFHLVIPSLPGLGFSDTLPNNTAVISTTAEILNSLMNRLEYTYYLVTNMASGSASPAEIDWKLANYLASQHSNSCLGAHFISPPLVQPEFQEAPIEWAKWSIANFFHAPILGYQSEDFLALKRSCPAKSSSSNKRSPTPAQFGLNQLGLREPNTLAYALCDSPTGLLVFVLKSLRLLGPKKEFTPAEIINFTQLAWLPGPESAMRLWAHCVQHPEKVESKGRRPKVAITVFLGDEKTEAAAAAAQRREEHQIGGSQSLALAETEGKESYACPIWANIKYHVVHTHRAVGKAGLLAWERPELIAEGVRGLAKAVLRLDSRLKPTPTASLTTAPLERVVTADAGDGAGTGGNHDGIAAEGPTTSTTTTMIPRDPTLQPATPAATDDEAKHSSLHTGAVVDEGLLAPIQEEQRARPQLNFSDETRVGVASDSEERDKDQLEKALAEKSDETLAHASPDTIYVDTPLRSIHAHSDNKDLNQG